MSRGVSLAAVVFCDFDNTQGRNLAEQYPNNFLSQNQFDHLADNLIPKPRLCHRLYVLRNVIAHDHTLLVYPVCIHSHTYHRNAFLFSLSFVLQDAAPPSAADAADAAASAAARVEKASSAAQRFGQVLRRACTYLSEIEHDTGMLSNRKGALRHLLPVLLHGLRRSGRCTLTSAASHSVQLALPPELAPPTPIAAHLVPVLVALPEQAEVGRWDLTLQQVFPYIDGTRCVARIAADATVDVQLVVRSLEALHAAGWVRLVDIFAFANTYACTRRVRDLARTPRLRADLQEASRPLGRVLPSFDAVFRLTVAFAPTADGSGWPSVADVCKRLAAEATTVDIRALVRFCILNGILRRVHAYPVAPPPQSRRDDIASETSSACDTSRSSSSSELGQREDKSLALSQSGRSSPFAEPPSSTGDGDASEVGFDALADESFGSTKNSYDAKPNRRYRDHYDSGKCTMDEICLRLERPLHKVEELLRSIDPSIVFLKR